MGRFVSDDPSGFRGGINFFTYVGDNPVNRRDAYGLDWRDAAAEALTGWPFDPISPRNQGQGIWPNGSDDRKRHCYYACIQMRRNGPPFSWWIPFDTVRQFGFALLKERSWGEAAGDTAADWWGANAAFYPTQTCQEQCDTCPVTMR
jgi:hypothetical protein